jgi:hypothetical protein
MVPSRALRSAGAAAGLFLLLALAACDAVGGPPRADGAASAVADVASAAVAGDGALLFPTRGADRFDLAFLPPDLSSGQPLRAEVIGRRGAVGPLASLLSRPTGDGRHEVALVLGSLRPQSVVVEARYRGRVVAAGAPAPGREGFVAGTFFQEPTSVHYFYYQGSNGEWVLGVEYDYDLHEGGGVTYESGRGLPVEVDRIRFVLRGDGQPGAPELLRIRGPERLVTVGTTGPGGRL